MNSLPRWLKLSIGIIIISSYAIMLFAAMAADIGLVDALGVLAASIITVASILIAIELIYQGMKK